MADAGAVGWFKASDSRADGQNEFSFACDLSKVTYLNYFVPITIYNNVSATANLRFFVPLTLSNIFNGALKRIYTKTVPAYLGGYSDTQVAGMSIEYSITGTVTDAVNAPVANAIVRLYYRPNGVMVREVRTNGSGVYLFNELPNLSEIFYLIAFDPTGTTNIGRLDRMTAG